VTVAVEGIAISDTVDIQLDLDTLCKPWKDAARDCRPDKPSIKVDSPIRRGPLMEVRAGYGYSGLDAEIGTWPVEIGGSKIKVQLGVYGRATMRPGGDFDGNAAAGARLEWR
jgi:hypothetical protein